MSVEHKFIHYNWNNGFETHNAILKTPYNPEVIIIGTFNHGWNWNPADFFYGRGMYMWTILDNLFRYNSNHLIQRRTLNNDNPTLEQILNICCLGKITFADVVLGTCPDVLTEQQGQSIIVNGEYNWNTYSDDHINFMGNQNWIHDNVDNIIQYINNNRTIRHIYFTFRSGNWLLDKLQTIIDNTETVSASSIFTPTGRGFGHNLPEYPNRAWSLTHCWVWNGLPNESPIYKINYGHLDHDWLINNNVTPNNF